MIICKGHDLLAVRCNDRLRDRKCALMDLVESHCNVAAKLDVLLLVNADRNNIGLIEKNVCRHEYGVGEKTCVDVVRMLGTLILKLRHAGKLTVHGEAVEDPGKLRVRGHVRLHVERVLFGVKTARHVKRQRFVGATAQLGGVLTYRDRMLVHDAVEALIRVGVGGEIADRAQIVANGEIAARLYAGVADFLFVDHT